MTHEALPPVGCAVGQDYWNAAYQSLQLEYHEERIEFRDLFHQYLPRGGTCFEVGCYPGSYLLYLGKHFGYSVSGIDTTPYILDRLPKIFYDHGIEVDEFYCNNFLTWNSPKTYNVVCSFGFVEHFFQFPEIIRRHVQLVGDGGYLIISCPNFRGLQRPLHTLLDRTNMRRHVLAAMDLRSWSRVLQSLDLSILHSGYYRTADFWTDSPEQNYLQHVTSNLVSRVMRGIDHRLHTPNRLTSPYLITIAKKESRDLR